MEKGLIKYALSVGKRMSSEYIEQGDYFPEESWGCEGQIYPSLMGIALLGLYKYQGEVLFLNGVKAIIETNIKKQLPSGGWPLLLGATGNGTKFEVSPEIMRITANIEDLPPTAAALRLMAEYKIYTGDDKYDFSLKCGYNFLKKFWNEEKLIFDEMLSGEALNLRANPLNYQVYAFQCVEAISKIYPEAGIYIDPLYVSIKKIFEDMDLETYPLLYALYTILIIQKEGPSEYVLNEVKSRIINDIAFGSKFRIKSIPGAIGHVDGLRGICMDEGHIRNAVGIAMTMKFYDDFVEQGCFTKSALYQDIKSWIQNMYHDGRYYEIMDLQSNVRMGLGTPGQFLPVWWILGVY